MYQRHTPKRTARTVAQIREEAARKQREDREARKEEADRKRRADANTTTGESPVPSSDTMPGSNKKKRSSIPTQLPTTAPPVTEANSGTHTADAAAQEQEPIQTLPLTATPHQGAAAVAVAANPTGQGIDTNLRDFLLSIKDELKKTTEDVVTKFDARMEKAEANIAELSKRVESGSKELEGKIKMYVRDEVAKVAKGAGPMPAITSSRREEAYHRCRRSLKMWPISGDDLEDSVKVFLRTRLKFEDQRIGALGKLEVSLPKGKAAVDRSEVIVLFEDREDRDTVKAAGYNLANQREAGMSIHVPGHLLDDLYALNSVAYNIKANNESSVKRSVKFDDAKLGLYLDICIADNWKRISPQEAKAVLKKVPTTMSTSTRSITMEELTGLVQWEAVANITAVVVPEDREAGEQ